MVHRRACACAFLRGPPTYEPDFDRLADRSDGRCAMTNYAKFYINGEWVDPISATPFDVINPATEEPVATISLGSAADVDRAVQAAKTAFSAYSQAAKDERVALLEKILATYQSRLADIAKAITAEMG